MEENKNQDTGWELIELTHLLPSVVPLIKDKDGKLLSPTPDGQEQPKIKITPAVRLVCFVLRDHADWSTWQTKVGLPTLANETKLDPRTVDHALAALRSADIISSHQVYNPNGTWSVAIRTFNRERLRSLVGPRVEDAGLKNALQDVREKGDGYISVTDARREETKSRLKHLADDFRIRIDEEPGVGNYCYLHIRPGADDALDADLVNDSDAMDDAPAPAPAKTSAPKLQSVASSAPSATTKRKKVAAPASVVDALLGLKHVGEKLRADVDNLALGIVADVGNEGMALRRIGLVDETQLIRASNANRPVAYFRDRIKRDYSAWFQQEVWPGLAQDADAGKPGAVFGKEIDARTLPVLIRETRKCAGSEYIVGEVCEGIPDWCEGDADVSGWVPITPAAPTPEPTQDDDPVCEPFDEPVYDEPDLDALLDKRAEERNQKWALEHDRGEMTFQH